MKRCNKRRYRDEVAAKLALASILRAYKCPACRKWHLTHLKEWSAA